MTLRRFYIGGPLLLLALSSACERRHPLGPSLEAASSASASPSVKAPSNTRAIAVSDRQINVSWRDNSTNETGFEVQWSIGPTAAFDVLVTTWPGVTSYSNGGLAPLTQHCYKVRALRTAGGKTAYSDFSTTACATTLAPPPPSAPSGTDAKPASSTAVDLNWVDNSSIEDGFRIERSLDGGTTWARVGTTDPSVVGFTDVGRTNEQKVCYRVIAFNRGGDSPPSNTDCTTPPAAPTNLTATAVADQPAIDLTWTDNSAVEDTYEVLRDNGWSFSVVAHLSANSTSYRDVTATSGTNGYYVQAKKDGGSSDPSDYASAECLHSDCPLPCSGSFDCPGGDICWGGVCVPHCGDGVQDGGETDVDCGGDWCATRCATGQTCWVDSDCASGICTGFCQPGPGGQP